MRGWCVFGRWREYNENNYYNPQIGLTELVGLTRSWRPLFCNNAQPIKTANAKWVPWAWVRLSNHFQLLEIDAHSWWLKKVRFQKMTNIIIEQWIFEHNVTKKGSHDILNFHNNVNETFIEHST